MHFSILCAKCKKYFFINTILKRKTTKVSRFCGFFYANFINIS